MTPDIRNTRHAAGWTFILLAMLLSFVMPAWARDFPKEARRGSMNAFKHPEVVIGKKVYRLVPASRIRNEQNLIIMPVAAPPKAEIMYRLDFTGRHIQDMWILTPEEAKALGPAPKQ